MHTIQSLNFPTNFSLDSQTEENALQPEHAKQSGGTPPPDAEAAGVHIEETDNNSLLNLYQPDMVGRTTAGKKLLNRAIRMNEDPRASVSGSEYSFVTKYSTEGNQRSELTHAESSAADFGGGKEDVPERPGGANSGTAHFRDSSVSHTTGTTSSSAYNSFLRNGRRSPSGVGADPKAEASIGPSSLTPAQHIVLGFRARNEETARSETERPNASNEVQGTPANKDLPLRPKFGLPSHPRDMEPRVLRSKAKPGIYRRIPGLPSHPRDMEPRALHSKSTQDKDEPIQTRPPGQENNRLETKVDRWKANWQPAASHPALTQEERENAYKERADFTRKRFEMQRMARTSPAPGSRESVS
jgi:hypothetical protein